MIRRFRFTSFEKNIWTLLDGGGPTNDEILSSTAFISLPSAEWISGLRCLLVWSEGPRFSSWAGNVFYSEKCLQSLKDRGTAPTCIQETIITLFHSHSNSTTR